MEFDYGTAVGIAGVVGTLGYALVEILKGLVGTIGNGPPALKRAVAAVVGAALGAAFAASAGIAVWPDGILAGLVGMGVIATARAGGSAMRGVAVFVVALGLASATACGGVRVCDEASLVLRDASTPERSRLAIECDGTKVVDLEFEKLLGSSSVASPLTGGCECREGEAQ